MSGIGVWSRKYLYLSTKLNYHHARFVIKEHRYRHRYKDETIDIFWPLTL